MQVSTSHSTGTGRGCWLTVVIASLEQPRNILLVIGIRNWVA
jgi:hypothetical protein